MANTPYYLAALASFTTPATHKDVFDRAVEMYGTGIKGNYSSARGSLDRFVLLGKAKKDEFGFYWIENIVDPFKGMSSKLLAAEQRIKQLESKVKELEGKLFEANLKTMGG